MLHDTRRRGGLAELLVAYRFLEAGRLVAWPFVPCAYDLVIDAGDRCYRVQVKQASLRDERNRGCAYWHVRLTKRNQTTKKDDAPREITECDILCVVTTPTEIYVIPAAACASPVDGRYFNARLRLGAESKYRLFLNRFAIGAGLAAEVTPSALPPLRKADLVIAERGRRRFGGERKPHHRLTPAEIDQIRQLPIRWLKRQPADGLIPLEEVARQFDVCPATLRKVAFYQDRLDLHRPVALPLPLPSVSGGTRHSRPPVFSSLPAPDACAVPPPRCWFAPSPRRA